jgi:hypothetical protein
MKELILERTSRYPVASSVIALKKIREYRPFSQRRSRVFAGQCQINGIRKSEYYATYLQILVEKRQGERSCNLALILLLQLIVLTPGWRQQNGMRRA